MRVVPKILGARASEHPCNFCEQLEQRPNFASTFKLNETILHPLQILFRLVLILVYLVIVYVIDSVCE